MQIWKNENRNKPNKKVDENEIKFNDFMLKMNKNFKTKKPNLNRYRMQFLSKHSWTLCTSKGLSTAKTEKKKKTQKNQKWKQKLRKQTQINQKKNRKLNDFYFRLIFKLKELDHERLQRPDLIKLSLPLVRLESLLHTGLFFF